MAWWNQLLNGPCHADHTDCMSSLATAPIANITPSTARPTALKIGRCNCMKYIAGAAPDGTKHRRLRRISCPLPGRAAILRENPPLDTPNPNAHAQRSDPSRQATAPSRNHHGQALDLTIFRSLGLLSHWQLTTGYWQLHLHAAFAFHLSSECSLPSIASMLRGLPSTRSMSR